MSIELSMLVPHAPSLCHEDQVPDFQQSIVSGFKEVSKEIAQIKPDVIVLVTCHWPSTFAHYVDCNPVHQGFLERVDLARPREPQRGGSRLAGRLLTDAL